jgi:malate dehydrogenase (oxaloacetate-decarboxylating)(NADP+)
MSDKLKAAALEYHRHPVPGKIRIAPTKALTTQKDLSLAYSPGVAAASELIRDNPQEVSNMTARANLVAVITNGTAVLGLGDIGPLAAKPVMEGKGVLFKKFADIDVFDIEIAENDPDKLVDIIASLEPTFGGINLEDIKAPECFEIEAKLRERVNIPIFHDDQHGTAIITAAAMINALRIIGKDIADIRMVASGAGAAGMACLDLLVQLGLDREHVTVCDSRGVIYAGREENMEPRKASYARETSLRTLGEAMEGADAFLGVSIGGVLTPDMVKSMADKPVILALANPDPEILPEDALAVRPDAIIATGRSDYPNQVNNVLCFPYIFRGALDVGATTINAEMQMACVKALAKLARKEVSDVSTAAYGDKPLQFGPQYLIPKPFDPRLLVDLAVATARAAMKSGAATRPIKDLRAYEEKLRGFLWKTSLVMKPVYESARRDVKRIAYAEGEEELVLRAVQSVIDDGLAEPVLIGRPGVVQSRIEKLGLRIRPGEDFELVNPESDPRFWNYWTTYHAMMERKGVSPDTAKAIVRTRNSVIAALMVHIGDADGMITGVVGRYRNKLRYVSEVIGLEQGRECMAALGVLGTEDGPYFVADTQVNSNPTAEQVAEITLMAAEKMRMFGIKPRVALMSHSSFGSHADESARKMKRAVELIRIADPQLPVEGEMPPDMALAPEYRKKMFPNSRLNGQANLLVMPDLDAAHIAYNLSRAISHSVTIGPILMGARKSVHIMTSAATVRRVINMTAIAAVDAQMIQARLERRQTQEDDL